MSSRHWSSSCAATLGGTCASSSAARFICASTAAAWSQMSRVELPGEGFVGDGVGIIVADSGGGDGRLLWSACRQSRSRCKSGRWNSSSKVGLELGSAISTCILTRSCGSHCKAPFNTLSSEPRAVSSKCSRTGGPPLAFRKRGDPPTGTESRTAVSMYCPLRVSRTLSQAHRSAGSAPAHLIMSPRCSLGSRPADPSGTPAPSRWCQPCHPLW